MENINQRPANNTDNAKAGQNALVVIKYTPFNAETPVSALNKILTPVEHFYVRSNFPTPQIAPDVWRLVINGALDKPCEVSLEELRSLPAITIMGTLECAGNNRLGYYPLPAGEPWGAGAVSTANWRGVPVRTVIERAGVHTTAVELLFEGADRGSIEGRGSDEPFVRSLPLAKALHPHTLLVYEMNGKPLPNEHGGPVRLLVPGWYGMASVKWLVRVSAAEQPFTGYFQAQRYVMETVGGGASEPLQEMLVKSIITSPREDETLALGRNIISGMAWSGKGAIREVEVSVEGGNNWHTARLVGDSNGPYAWRQWEYTWEATRPGRHVLRARATDEHGNIQPDAAAWNRLGYANNAVQPMIVHVREEERRPRSIDTGPYASERAAE